MLVGINLYWGLTQVLLKHALLYMSSSMYTVLRFAAAFVIVFAFALKHHVHLDGNSIKHGAVLGMLVGAQMLLGTFSLYFTSTTNAVFIAQMSLVLVPLFCFWRERRRPTWRYPAALLTVLSGLLMFTGMLAGSFNFGDLIASVAMLGSCAQILYTARVAACDDVRALATVQMLVASVSALPFAILQGNLSVSWTPESVAIIFLTGAIGSGVCHALMPVVQQHVSPSSVAFINVLYPVCAMVGAALIPSADGLVEHITAAKLAGAAVMIIGMTLYVFGNDSSVHKAEQHRVGEIARFEDAHRS